MDLLIPAIVVICVMIIVVYCPRMKAEPFRSCRHCDGYFMPRAGMSVLNPFIYPYSATPCVDELYMLNKDRGIDFGFVDSARPTLTSPSAPDHVAKTT